MSQSNRYRAIFGAGMTAIALMLTACTPTQPPIDQAYNVAQNTSYPDGAPVNRTGTLEQTWTDSTRSLTFSNGRYSGNTGCNNFSGTYEIIGANRVRINPMALTRKYCSNKPKLMQDEANFAKNLPGEYSYRIEGNSLLLVNNQRSWTLATGPK